MKKVLSFQEFMAAGIKLPAVLAAQLGMAIEPDESAPIIIVYPGDIYAEWDPEQIDHDLQYSCIIGRCDFTGDEESKVAKYAYLYYLEERCADREYPSGTVESMRIQHHRYYNIPKEWYW